MLRALVTTILAIASICILLTAKAQAHPAWGIAVDHQGQVYFSDLKTIWKIDVQDSCQSSEPEDTRMS